MTKQELEKIRADVSDALEKIRAHGDSIESSMKTLQDSHALAWTRRVQDGLSETLDALSP